MSDDQIDEGQDSDSTEDLDFDSEQATKLTNWKNEPTIEALKADLEEAQSDHNSHVADVNKWRDMYDGKPNFPIVINRSKVVPKTIRKQAEWRYTALSEPFLSADNMFEVEPVTFEDKERAEQNKLVINHQMNNRMDKVRFIDEYVRTAVDEGTVVIKVGWKAVEGTIQLDEPVYKYIPAQEQQAIEQLGQKEMEKHQMMQYEPLVYEKEVPAHEKKLHELFMQTGVPHIAIHTGNKRTTKEKMVRNHPTWEICPYDKVVLDPTCKGRMEDAQFIIYQFSTTLSELKKDSRYKNLNLIDAKNVLEDADDDEASTFNFQDKPRQKLTVYEYWGFYDIDGAGVVKPFMASWVGKVKIRMEKNPFPDQELPFIKVKYLPVIGMNYGHPDGHLLADNQQIIGAVTRSMIDMMGRSAAGQQGVRKDSLDVTNSRKFEQGEDYKFNTNIDPRQAFHMGQFPEIPNSALDMINLQNLEAESLTGVKAYSQGISGAALGSTATAVRGALDAASKRELGILRRLAEGVAQVGRKMISMNAEFLEDEEVIRITNDEFITVRRDDLAGHYDVRLSISTAESDNEKAQELSFMLQTMGNNMDPTMSQMLLADIAKLRKMPKLAQKIEEYQPAPPDPLTQKREELEVALLEAQVANENAKAQENQVDVGLKTAKTATEEAKVRSMDSTADKTDLDFLEQQQGVSHERDMDKLDHNAENKASENEHKQEGAVNLKALESQIKKDERQEERDNPEISSIMKNFNL